MVREELELINPLASALHPIVSRVRTSTCCVKKPGEPPARINQALTPAKIAKHCNGGPAYGVYPMQAGESMTMLALADLDSHKGETPWHDMQAAALRLMSAMEARGLKPIPFRSSGGAGLHLYVLWEQPQDARSVRAAMRAALADAGFADGTGGVAKAEVEVFPKQDTIPVDGYGNMFVMPLAGMSVPLDAFELDDMPKEAMIGFDWPISEPVAFVEKSVVEVATGATPEGITPAMLSALDAIPNSGDDELEYDDYRTVLFAIHHESGGSDEGLALVHEFAARSSKYVAEKTTADWGYAGRGGDRAPITGASITFLARTRYQWQEDVSGDFEVIVPEPGETQRPSYKRNGKGEIEAVIENVVKALRSPIECGASIRRDDFRADNMIDDRPVVDEDLTRLQIQLERIGFLKLSKDMVRDALYFVAQEQRYDSAIEWIGTLKWDGVPRIERFLIDHFGAADTPYVRAVGRYTWTALAGRALVPGVQADMVPTLVGDQGIGKTQGVKAMAPAPELFCELGFADRDIEASRKMRGRLVIELGELRGMSARDIEGVKAFITRQTELFRDLYRNSMTEFRRRHLFIGTTNKEQFLNDDTGERRWLPVRVAYCNPLEIERDRDQLWAEASVVFQQHGIAWQDAQRLAGTEHDAFKLCDPFEPAIEAWLDREDMDGSLPRNRDFLRTEEVLSEAVNIDAKATRPEHTMRVAAILKKRGYKRARPRINGVKTWIFLRDRGDDLL